MRMSRFFCQNTPNLRNKIMQLPQFEPVRDSFVILFLKMRVFLTEEMARP
jgi:hypothetical protein